MKYIANPVVVEAYRIANVAVDLYKPEEIIIRLSDGTVRRPIPEMLARIQPVKGDYWVIQADGYEYLNPKDVFERKYSPVQESGE